MPRLFVAIDLPHDVRAALVTISREFPAARWVPENQLHLTLRFIGEVDAGTVALLKEKLADSGGALFQLTLQGVGHFPPGKRARVLWVGILPSPELQILQSQIEDGVTRAGIPPEERPFAPHITLARFREPPTAGELERFEVRNRLLTLGPFAVREFHLYSSLLSGSGATHRVEATYPLRK